MNLKKVSAAVTATLAGLVTGTALALPASQYNATPGDTLDVFISGASAQDEALERLLRNTCVSGTLDIYRAGGNQRVLFCRISNATVPGFPGGAGQKVAVHKTSEGGSGSGVQPVANQTQVGFINMNAIKNGGINCGNVNNVPAETVAGTTFAGYTEHNGCVGNLRNAVPDAGISDVEPRLFEASDSEIARLTVRSQNAVIWGVPVTIALRNALQQVQGLAVGSNNEANMPSLTREQLTSIYTGQIFDWNFLLAANGSSLPSAPGVSAPADTNVYLCRRVPTSGTQASFETYFLRARCAEGVLGMPGASNTVNVGSGTSNVRACLRDHNAGNRWAVGLFSTENVEELSNSSDNHFGWRFIKINGHAPTLLNVANGKYDFYSEQSIQWRNASSGNALSGLKLTLMQDIATNAGSPPIIRALNAGFTHPWGQGGVMALPTNGHIPTFPSPGNPLTAAQIAANPVNTSTKSPTGSPNNCQPPVVLGAPQNASTRF